MTYKFLIFFAFGLSFNIVMDMDATSHASRVKLQRLFPEEMGMYLQGDVII